MPGELSHNLPKLVTSSNRMLRADTMKVVPLLGLNGLDWSITEPSEAGFLEAAGLTEDEVAKSF
jgi:hypothetical protein